MEENIKVIDAEKQIIEVTQTQKTQFSKIHLLKKKAIFENALNKINSLLENFK